MAEGIKKCAWCDKPAAIDKLKRSMTTCGSVECKRKQAAERKRRQRQREKEAAEGPPPFGEREDGTVVAPFGPEHEPVTYDSTLDAEVAACRMDYADAVNGVEPSLPEGYLPDQRGKRYTWRQWWLIDNEISSEVSPDTFLDKLIQESPSWTQN